MAAKILQLWVAALVLLQTGAQNSKGGCGQPLDPGQELEVRLASELPFDVEVYWINKGAVDLKIADVGGLGGDVSLNTFVGHRFLVLEKGKGFDDLGAARGTLIIKGTFGVATVKLDPTDERLLDFSYAPDPTCENDDAESETSSSSDCEDSEDGVCDAGSGDPQGGEYPIRRSSWHGSKHTRQTTTAMGVKFRNAGAKTLEIYYDPGNGQPGQLQMRLKPGEDTSTNTYHGHKFFFAEKGDASAVIARFTMNKERRLVAYVDAENASPDVLAHHYEEVAFASRYQAKTGRPWIAHYPPNPVKHFMWSAEQIGQTHTVTTPHVHTLGPDGERSQEAELKLTLEVTSTTPRSFVIKGFLSDYETEHLVELAGGKLRRSTVHGVRDASHGMESYTRTSRNTWIGRSRSEVVDVLFRRAADLVRIDEAELTHARNAEQLQLVHYNVGDKYDAHHDWGANNSPDTRFITLLLYLNDKVAPDAGGETSFPKADVESPAGLKVHPGRGSAVLFYNRLPDGNVDDFALHAALPVRRGEKWLANFWIWENKNF